MRYGWLVLYVFVLGAKGGRTATDFLERPLYTSDKDYNRIGVDMGSIDLRLGDCLEIMKTIPDKSIDLVLTDPPYGIGADKGVGGAYKKGVSMRGIGIYDLTKNILPRC